MIYNETAFLMHFELRAISCIIPSKWRTWHKGQIRNDHDYPTWGCLWYWQTKCNWWIENDTWGNWINKKWGAKFGLKHLGTNVWLIFYHLVSQKNSITIFFELKDNHGRGFTIMKIQFRFATTSIKKFTIIMISHKKHWGKYSKAFSITFTKGIYFLA